jgi:hypothetical protein
MGCAYSSEVQQRQLPRAAEPIFDLPPDLVSSFANLDRRKFTPKRSPPATPRSRGEW